MKGPWLGGRALSLKVASAAGGGGSAAPRFRGAEYSVATTENSPAIESDITCLNVSVYTCSCPSRFQTARHLRITCAPASTTCSSPLPVTVQP